MADFPEIEFNSPDGNSSSLDKGLRLLTAIIRDRGQSKLSGLADDLAIPQSTARRLLSAFQKHGFVSKAERGHYVPGGILRELGLAIGEQELLRRVARSCLRRFAGEYKATIHLGVLEAGMVTYLLKEQGGPKEVFSKEGGQLEAYCSAIGKMLLAQLPHQQIKEYLKEGELVPLTANTIVDPRELLRELRRVRNRNYSIDNAEISEDMFCVAVPLELGAGFSQLTGLSVTLLNPLSEEHIQYYASALKSCAAEIRKRIT